MVLGLTTGAGAAGAKYSSWFAPYYKEMQELGILPSSFHLRRSDRHHHARRDVRACGRRVRKRRPATSLTWSAPTGFTDTTDENIVKAHLYGIVNGYEDGSFRPNQLLTRQEFFKLIENFCTAAAFSPTAADGALNGFADANKISSWGEGICADLREPTPMSGHESSAVAPI